MNTIKEQNSIIFKLFGNSEYNPECKYRLFTYCYIIKFNDIYLLFNTMTRQLIELSAEEYNNFQANVIDDTYINLVKQHCLVPVNHDDYSMQKQLRETVKLLSFKKGLTDFVILPTIDCNARCFYCFEYGVQKEKMSKQTAHDVAKYIIANSFNQKVKIKWFGGEPLYNIECIDIICDELSKNGQEFHSTMISNGYLMNDEVVSRALNNWNLKNIQITLDGTENVYNRCKNYIYGNNPSPFAVVLDNIEKAVRADIHVIIRLNLGEHNREDLINLVKQLSERFSDYKNKITVYSWLLYDNRGMNKKRRTDFERHSLNQNQFELQSLIEEFGFGFKGVLSDKVQTVSCHADNPNGAIILPNGDLGKCDHFYSGSNEIWGSIYNDNINHEVINSWKELLPRIKLCETCPLVPQCLGVKKCPDAGEYDCDFYIQKRKFYKLNKQIVNTYKAYIENR